jgi:general secretion pathway protein K
MKPHSRQAQRGAAILTAMLTVVLVASLASATLWQQWRAVEVETAERSRMQSAWVLVGALDWARLILREDGRKGGVDHLAEPWAVPLAQSRLSTFLAADRNDTTASDDMQAAFLSGQIIDRQSRLNITNLVLDGKVHAPSRLAFARLFNLLNLPEAELSTLTDQLRLAQAAPATGGAPNASDGPLLPQTVDQLAWLGWSASTIELLRPFITLLPVRTPVNLNTASAEVIYASVDGLEFADANRLVQVRSTTHFSDLAEVSKVLTKTTVQLNETQHSVKSSFFEIRGSLRIDQTEVQEQSVVQRDGLTVKTLWRQRGPATVMPTLQ